MVTRLLKCHSQSWILSKWSGNAHFLHLLSEKTDAATSWGRLSTQLSASNYDDSLVTTSSAADLLDQHAYKRYIMKGRNFTDTTGLQVSTFELHLSVEKLQKTESFGCFACHGRPTVQHKGTVWGVSAADNTVPEPMVRVELTYLRWCSLSDEKVKVWLGWGTNTTYSVRKNRTWSTLIHLQPFNRANKWMFQHCRVGLSTNIPHWNTYSNI